MANWSWVRRRARVRLAVALVGAALAATVTGGGLLAPDARALPNEETWAAELSVAGGDDTNVIAANGAIRLGTGNDRPLSARSPQAQGELLLPPRRPAAATTRVAAVVTADVPPGASVEVDVRGTRSDGSWGEWTPSTPSAPAMLGEAAVDVQVRLTLTAGQFGASPSVQRVLLDADRAATSTPPTSGTTPSTTTPGTTSPSTTSPSTTSPSTTSPSTTSPSTTSPSTTSPSTTSPSTTSPSTTSPSTTSPSTTSPSTTSPSTTSPSRTSPSTTSSLVAPVGPLLSPPFQSRAFASRVGLVGNATANGHVVTPRDRFVALPSGRVRAPRDTGDYTVQVCNATRCAWAPVWDVGPWNIRDDYWNSQQVRENWGVLAQGLPMAQAAYQGNFNGGRDGFGRTISNPAGIDLADGTFWDDLGMTGNGWVTVSYLWTGRGPAGIARPGTAPMVPARNAPTSTAAQVGTVAPTARVFVTCSATGETQSGTQGTSNQWLRIAPTMFVPAAQVEAPRVAAC